MGSAAVRRLSTEIQTAKDLEGIYTTLVDGDIFEWQGVIVGPENTPYEHGIFHFTLHIPPTYPFKSPLLRLFPLQRIRGPAIMHLNMCTSGCHFWLTNGELLTQEGWRPKTKVNDILRAIRDSLADQFTSSKPYNTGLAEYYQRDKVGYGHRVRKHVREYAMPTGYGNRYGIDMNLVYQVEGVPSLMYQCRRTVRSIMKNCNPWDITEDIDTLPLPGRMKTFLK